MQTQRIFHYLGYALIIIGFLWIFGLIIQRINYEKKRDRKAILFIAGVTGFLVYLGFDAIGISIPSLIVSALKKKEIFNFILFGTIAPAFLGFLTAWYYLKFIKDIRANDMPLRLAMMFLTFSLGFIFDVFLKSSQVDRSNFGNLPMLPNITFIITLSIYLILKYKKESYPKCPSEFIGEEICPIKQNKTTKVLWRGESGNVYIVGPIQVPGTAFSMKQARGMAETWLTKQYQLPIHNADVPITNQE